MGINYLAVACIQISGFGGCVQSCDMLGCTSLVVLCLGKSALVVEWELRSCCIVHSLLSVQFACSFLFVA